MLKNFKIKEFSCRCGCATPAQQATALRAVACCLAVVRNHFNKPVIINSAYRCVPHNTKVGGASRSYHLKGMAVDIVIPGTTPSQVYNTIVQMMEGGLILKGGVSLYPTFVHYDIRGSIVTF